MKDLVQSATSDRGSPEMSSMQTLDRAFAATLATHLTFCDWSAEGWRWYINDLEEKLQSITQTTLSAPVVSVGPVADTIGFSTPLRTQTQKIKKSFKSIFFWAQTQATNSTPKTTKKHQYRAVQRYTDPVTGLTQQLPPGVRESGTSSPMDPLKSRFEDYQQQDFSFADLRKIHQIEEKANEAALTLKLNLKIISQLIQYYKSVVESMDFPKHIAHKCVFDINCFEVRIDGIRDDLELQALRIETLLRLNADRKTMLTLGQLYGILNYLNTEANKVLAHQSRSLTDKMEKMTKDMNEIARKTKSETVSMKIITLVTLFFLPGTFIS
ncbi:MAG: hypothetical protein Q9164_005518, partial [Protoblastenia rupestris]